MDDAAVAQAYYSAIDDGNYDELRTLLAEAFVQVRPDRTLNGPDRFVQFMRDDRPITETEHTLTGIYHGREGVAVHGNVVTSSRHLFEFIDTFQIKNQQITRLTTYTR